MKLLEELLHFWKFYRWMTESNRLKTSSYTFKWCCSNGVMTFLCPCLYKRYSWQLTDFWCTNQSISWIFSSSTYGLIQHQILILLLTVFQFIFPMKIILPLMDDNHIFCPFLIKGSLFMIFIALARNINLANLIVLSSNFQNILIKYLFTILTYCIICEKLGLAFMPTTCYMLSSPSSYSRV